MIRLATEKVCGEVRAISAEFSWKRGNSKPWLLDKKLAGGGAMFDTGVYSIQAGCYITNKTPIAVTAVPSTSAQGYPPEIEESMSFILEYPGGAVMQGRASYEYGRQSFVVCAENGVFSCVRNSFAQSAMGKPSPKEIILPNGKSFKAADTLQLAVLHDRFAEAIRTKQPFACPGEMGLRDIRLLEAVYTSVAQGSKRLLI